MLGVHFVFIALGDAEQAVQAPAVFTAAVNEGGDPFFGVVVIGFFVLGGQLRIGANGITCCTNFFYQFVAATALQHINLPGLCVGARRGSGSQLQQVRDGRTRHWRW